MLTNEKNYIGSKNEHKKEANEEKESNKPRFLKNDLKNSVKFELP